MPAGLLADPGFWKNASIPFVAAVVGWATNWVAVRMTFRPLEFVGRRPWLGWQGIIPSKARKMAAIFVDTSMARLGTLDELAEALEPPRIARHIADSLAPRLQSWVDEIVEQSHPELWSRLPAPLRTRLYLRVHDKLPELLEEMVREAGSEIVSLIDFKAMITERLETDKELLNRLFLESGAEEFRFIVRSGLYFGFLFGLVQLAVWVFVGSWWVLPLFGLAVGYATNWIALNLIFRPLEPRRVGPWTVQGLFLKRQREVAGVWCRIVTREILTVRALVEAMVHGPRAERLQAIVRKHVRPIVDESLGLLGGVAQMTLGEESLARMRRDAADRALAVSTDLFDDPLFREERAEVAESFLRRRMEALPAAQFQDLLRPCFQEEEMLLILVGAALGCLAGWAQLILVFGGI